MNTPNRIEEINSNIDTLWKRKNEISQEIERIKEKEIAELVAERIRVSQEIEQLFNERAEIEKEQGKDVSFRRIQ